MWANPASWLSAQQNLQEILSFPESRTEIGQIPDPENTFPDPEEASSFRTKISLGFTRD